MQVLHGMRTDDPSYVLRIDTATGKTLWRVERPTQRAVRIAGRLHDAGAAAIRQRRREIVVTGGDVVTGHDPATGKELWRANGLNPDNDGSYRIVASPVVHGDLIVAPSRERPMLALKAGGRGDVTQVARAVVVRRTAPTCRRRSPTAPISTSINDRGIMWCLDAKTGKEIYGRQRLRPATYSGSPVLADGKIYVTNEDGVTRRRESRTDVPGARAKTISTTTRSARRRSRRDRSSFEPPRISTASANEPA